jgi:hypothetical protein
MADQDAEPGAAVAGAFALGGDLVVNRLGFCAMRLTGKASGANPRTARKPATFQ